jgi:hypothetical protein
VVALLPRGGVAWRDTGERTSGNRQLNSALHEIAVVQGRWEPRARAYLERRHAEGKTRREALPCLKHHLVRVVFRLLRQASGGRPQLVLKVRGPALA